MDDLGDIMIREMNAEIDRDAIRRFSNGERIIQTSNGLEWAYVVGEDVRVIIDSDKLRQLLGH